MTEVTSALAQLDEIAEELTRRGDDQLAEKARAAVCTLREATAPPELIGTEEAAKLLGIRSAPMVMRWARERRLEGFNVGGRVKVSRRSVEKMVGSPIVRHQQESERELAEILDAFDAGDMELPPSYASSAGRAPWDAVAPRKS